MNVILSYFHTRIGTSIFYSFPKKKDQLDKEMSDRLYDIMTQQKEQELFIHTFENLKIINFYFQIFSEWARGKREMVMISTVINQHVSPEIEESMASLCKEFSIKMQLKEDIYTGFYINDLTQYEKEKDRIVKNEAIIRQMVQDLYWKTIEETKKKFEEEKITLLLNDRYIFESLAKMLDELKNISSEIDKFECPSDATSDVKRSISNLNRIIDDLYDGFMEKMASLEIENEEDLFPTEEEMEDDIRKSKEEILQVLQEELDSSEEEDKEEKETANEDPDSDTVQDTEDQE
jgi:hypothetical protein